MKTCVLSRGKHTGKLPFLLYYNLSGFETRAICSESFQKMNVFADKVLHMVKILIIENLHIKKCQIYILPLGSCNRL